MLSAKELEDHLSAPKEQKASKGRVQPAQVRLLLEPDSHLH